jgi:DNA-binding IclR family transcriptional regulator
VGFNGGVEGAPAADLGVPDVEATMIQAIDRAVGVLYQLQGARRMGITELAGALSLPPSTVHGIVKSLAEHGLVAKEPGSDRYQLGPALLKLSSVYLDTLEIRVRALRWSAELARRTGLAVRVGVPLADEVIIICHEPRPDGSQQMPEVGLTIPAHASALGKAIMAYDKGFYGVVVESGLRPLTGETLTDAESLQAQLAEVAATGIAEEADEAILGESSLAAPIADQTGRVVAAIGVVLPTTAWPLPTTTTDSLTEAARNTSREMGYPTWPPGVG